MVVAAGGIVDVGIDSAAEDRVEAGVERGPPETPPTHVAPGECGQMARVKDERMAERDRPLQDGPGPDQREESIRPLPQGLEAPFETKGERR